MLIDLLAGEPDAPVQLLEPVITIVAEQDPQDTYDTRTKLVENPAVDLAHLDTLLTGMGSQPRALRAGLVSRALTRPHLTTDQVLHLLSLDTTATTLHTALTHHTDPDVAAYTATHLTSGEAAAIKLMTMPGVDPAHARTAATFLAAKPHLVARTVGVLCDHAIQTLGRATTPGQAAEARTHVQALIATGAHQPALVQQLIRVLNADHTTWVGTRPWLTDPHTTTDQVLDWAGRGGAERFTAALTHRPDTSGDILAAGRSAHPHRPELLRAGAAQHHPVRVRQTALLALTDLGHATGGDVLDRELFSAGEVDAAVALAVADPGNGLTSVLHRADLTSDHLDQLLDVYIPADPLCPTPLWTATTLAAHRSATRAHRQAAADLLDLFDTDADLQHVVYDLAAGVDPADLPVPVVRDNTTHPHLRRLVAHTLDRVLPGTVSVDTARTLIALYDTFPGTLADLVTTATTITR